MYAAWEHSDEWYYGTVEEVCCVETVKTYKIRFDDDTSESNVLAEDVQFISRPDKIDVTDDVTSNTNDTDTTSRGDVVISLLDPLGENTIVEDVEIQEIWE